jgi:hypothetical protein
MPPVYENSYSRSLYVVILNLFATPGSHQTGSIATFVTTAFKFDK